VPHNGIPSARPPTLNRTALLTWSAGRRSSRMVGTRHWGGPRPATTEQRD